MNIRLHKYETYINRQLYIYIVVGELQDSQAVFSQAPLVQHNNDEIQCLCNVHEKSMKMNRPIDDACLNQLTVNDNMKKCVFQQNL